VDDEKHETHAVTSLTNTIDAHFRTISDSLLTSIDSVVTSSSQKITTNVENIVQQAQDNAKQAFESEAMEAMAVLATSTIKITESAQSYSDILKNNPTIPRHGPPAVSGLNPRQKATQAIKDRQILIDFDSNDTILRLKMVSDTFLVEKANFALKDLIGTETCKFVSATCIRNRGILLEMNDPKDITWLLGPNVKDPFLKAFEPMAIIKPLCFSTFLQFVPITFMPDKEADLGEIEETNNMVLGSRTHTKWVKPIARCAVGQTCGHIILVLSSPQAANKILTNGLRITHKLVYATKCRREPLLCLKCHGWNHIANDCIVNHDTCGSCGAAHRTNACDQPAMPMR
jgi:hypothetical protein